LNDGKLGMNYSSESKLAVYFFLKEKPPSPGSRAGREGSGP